MEVYIFLKKHRVQLGFSLHLVNVLRKEGMLTGRIKGEGEERRGREEGKGRKGRRKEYGRGGQKE